LPLRVRRFPAARRLPAAADDGAPRVSE